MEKEKKIEELISLAEKYGCFRFSEMGFNTKSGVMFKFEADLRKACDSFYKAKIFLKQVYNLILSKDPNIDYFLGIPDTGSLIATVLNMIHQEQNPHKNIPLNMVRSEAKAYIKSSPVTVNPVLEAKNICLIEDDVVTGQTLMHYLYMLKCLPRKRLLVFSILDRQLKDENGDSLEDRIKKEFGYPYYALIKMEHLEPYFHKSLSY